MLKCPRNALTWPLAALAMLLLTPFTGLHAQSGPSFDGSTGILSLPVVDVPGTGVVNATLGLSSQSPIQFTLQSASVYSTPPDGGQQRGARRQRQHLVHPARAGGQ